MKKIVVAFDGSYYSEAALEMAIQVARREEAVVAGLFLEDVTAYHQFSPIFEAPEVIGLAEEVIQELKSEVKDNLTINMERFRKTCEAEGVSYVMEAEEGIPSMKLVEETQWADLCVIGSVTYFSNLTIKTESRLLSELLFKAHSPVLVVPEKVDPLTNVLLTYDGSSSAVYAMKRYLHLFPRSAASLPATLLSVVKHEGDEQPHLEELFNYLRMYIPHLEKECLVGHPSEEILHRAKTVPGSLVIMGGYGRNAFSQLLKSSVGKKVVHARAVPVLVAHE